MSAPHRSWPWAFAVAAVFLAPAVHAQGASSMLRVACDGDSIGAEITINGKFKGECPLDIEVQAGNVELRALKRVPPDRERLVVQTFGMGEGVVKRLDIKLGPPALTEAARRAAAERQREADERKRAAAEEARVREQERKKREAEAAARLAEMRSLAAQQATLRQRDQQALRRQAFAAAGLVAGNGQAFRDCPECPELVWIPAGRAPQVAGASESQRWYNGFELAVPLAVGRFEVTFTEWDTCVAQNGCSARPAEGVSEGMIFDSKWGRGRQPVINVSQRDARQYVDWLSRKTGQSYRLLSQIEFNYASRAGAAGTYPWGEQLDVGAANCRVCGGKSTERTLEVGSFAANAWGLHDMIGNVAEWVADCYGARNQASSSTESWERWVKLAQHPGDASPIDQCSAAAGRTAVSDPSVGNIGGSFATGLRGPLLFAQHAAANGSFRSVGLRVARDFTLPPPVIDKAALAPFRDCADCPELVSLPAGRFEMGTPYLSPLGYTDSEFPLRWVDVAPFAIGRFELTRGQFAAFVRETGHAVAPGCLVVTVENKQSRLTGEPARSWADPGFVQADDHPVTCVGRDDALAYLAWLGRKTGQRYRLPSEAEWEYAGRAGSDERRPWGAATAQACEFANLRDARFHAAHQTTDTVCDDGHAATAPVGRFKPNPWGLHDMLGNVTELVEDCARPNYQGAPADASAWRQDNCGQHRARGGSWFTVPGAVVMSWPGRGSAAPQQRAVNLGFRVVRETVPAAAAASTSAPAASVPALPLPPLLPASLPVAPVSPAGAR